MNNEVFFQGEKNMHIEINPEDGHGPKLIELDKEEELFHGAFLQANKALDEIIAATKRYNDDDKDNQYDKLYCFENNIIAFCGKRGQGKTSAMISFAKNLNENKRDNKFLILPTIDPTMLEAKDSILNVILSRLFLRSKEIWEDSRNNGKKINEIEWDKLSHDDFAKSVLKHMKDNGFL